MRNIPLKKLGSPSVGYKINRNEKLRRSPRKKFVSQRKLEFKEDKTKKLLSGCTFFLDIHTPNRLMEVKKQINRLGGDVEEFLSKEISFVITSQKHDVSNSQKCLNLQNPPVPSPLPSFSHQHSLMQVPSPFSSDSFQHSTDTSRNIAKVNNLSVTRGKQALNKVVPPKQEANDVITKASRLGAKVISVEEFMTQYTKKRTKDADCAKLKKTLHLVPKNKATQHGNSSKTHMTQLHETFFKVEDKSRLYRPIVFEMKAWPEIYPNTCIYQCPFEIPRTKQPRKIPTMADEIDGLSVSEQREKNDIKRSGKEVARTRKRKAGYCDCCGVRYDVLQEHLKGSLHQKFSLNAANFSALDQLIFAGTSFEEFLIDSTWNIVSSKNYLFSSSPTNQKRKVVAVIDDDDVSDDEVFLNFSKCAQQKSDGILVTRNECVRDNLEKDSEESFVSDKESNVNKEEGLNPGSKSQRDCERTSEKPVAIVTKHDPRLLVNQVDPCSEEVDSPSTKCEWPPEIPSAVNLNSTDRLSTDSSVQTPVRCRTRRISRRRRISIDDVFSTSAEEKLSERFQHEVSVHLTSDCCSTQTLPKQIDLSQSPQRISDFKPPVFAQVRRSKTSPPRPQPLDDISWRVVHDYSSENVRHKLDGGKLTSTYRHSVYRAIEISDMDDVIDKCHKSPRKCASVPAYLASCFKANVTDYRGYKNSFPPKRSYPDENVFAEDWKLSRSSCDEDEACEKKNRENDYESYESFEEGRTERKSSRRAATIARQAIAKSQNTLFFTSESSEQSSPLLYNSMEKSIPKEVDAFSKRSPFMSSTLSLLKDNSFTYYDPRFEFEP